MTGDFDELGLANLAEFMPATARVKIDPLSLDWKTGNELYESANDNIRLGVTGESNTGKTYNAIAYLEHRIINKAADDYYISRFFKHNHELRDAALAMSIEQRRILLKQAHLMVFVDFDNRGLEKLIAGYTINPLLYDCLDYVGAETWEHGIQALFDAKERLRQHEENGWGKMGCWVVVDNMTEVWEEVQSDDVQQSHGGMTHLEIRGAAQAKHPGRDKAARSLQGEETGGRINWNNVKGQLRELFKPLLNSGWNVILTAPPKFRKRKVKDERTNEEVEFEMNSIGGAKEVIFWCDWVIHRFISIDQVSRYARFDKCRWTGLTPKEVYDPTPENLEFEMERLLAQHIEIQKKKFELKQLAEKVSIDLSKFGIKNVRDAPETIVVEARPPAPLPRPPNVMVVTKAPLPLPGNGEAGLADMSIMPKPAAEDKELPMPLPSTKDKLLIMDATTDLIRNPKSLPTPIPSGDLPNSPDEVDDDQSFITDFTGETFDNSHLLPTKKIEVELDPEEIEMISEGTHSLEDIVRERKMLDKMDKADEIADLISETALGFISEAPVSEAPDLDVFLVSSSDRGKGKYHLPGCGRLSKIKVGLVETFNPQGREACKTCKPPEPVEDAEEIQDEFEEIIRDKAGAPSKQEEELAKQLELSPEELEEEDDF